LTNNYISETRKRQRKRLANMTRERVERVESTGMRGRVRDDGDIKHNTGK
jgi:hypothetical protein